MLCRIGPLPFRRWSCLELTAPARAPIALCFKAERACWDEPRPRRLTSVAVRVRATRIRHDSNFAAGPGLNDDEQIAAAAHGGDEEVFQLLRPAAGSGSVPDALGLSDQRLDLSRQWRMNV